MFIIFFRLEDYWSLFALDTAKLLVYYNTGSDALSYLVKLDDVFRTFQTTRTGLTVITRYLSMKAFVFGKRLPPGFERGTFSGSEGFAGGEGVSRNSYDWPGKKGAAAAPAPAAAEEKEARAARWGSMSDGAAVPLPQAEALAQVEGVRA